MQAPDLYQFIAHNFPQYHINLLALNAIQSIAECVQFRKNEVLFAEGKIAHKMVLVLKGNLMAYDTQGGTKKVHRIWFNQQPILITQSLLHQKPLNFTVVALNDCSLLLLNYTKLISLTEACPKIWELLMLLMAFEHQLLQAHILLLSQEPKQRYHTFMRSHAALWQILTANLLASYLNMGYSTFARFRQARD